LKPLQGDKNTRFEKLREVVYPVFELKEEKQTFVKVGKKK
jgi:hypothetical protein